MLPVKEIPLDSITLRADFMRDTYSPEKYGELRSSIQQFGILYPPLVLQDGESYTLVFGYRRFQAAKELGLPSIPCMIMTGGIDEAEILRLHENLFREDISPLQEALSFLRLERVYHMTREKISKLTGKSKSYITQKIQILDWPENLKDALAKELISYSIGRELLRVSDTLEQNRLLNICITSGATVRTLLGWITDWQNMQSIQHNSTSKQKEGVDQLSLPFCVLCGNAPPNVTLTNQSVCNICSAELDKVNDSAPHIEPETLIC